ncbi:hypothetical protein BS47DRAFT_1337448 [Hydnum rufescens UP504]|uniref:Uncharacterized protein n=1 Tax=Hydnum rufescens UP504 TaxID=1448309 RepID=A0A9P6E1B6_9AGAM|nr:hypothetical protein BS47DRAFT_1337448 [Hydnum rufescens UP504]
MYNDPSSLRHSESTSNFNLNPPDSYRNYRVCEQLWFLCGTGDEVEQHEIARRQVELYECYLDLDSHEGARTTCKHSTISWMPLTVSMARPTSMVFNPSSNLLRLAISIPLGSGFDRTFSSYVSLGIHAVLR